MKLGNHNIYILLAKFDQIMLNNEHMTKLPFFLLSFSYHLTIWWFGLYCNSPIFWYYRSRDCDVITTYNLIQVHSISGHTNMWHNVFGQLCCCYVVHIVPNYSMWIIKCCMIAWYQIAIWCTVSRRQVKHFTKVSKMSTFWNLVTIFGITMRNAFK